MPLMRACCELRRCEPAKARVWSLGVVVDSPCFDDLTRLRKVAEQMLVETLVAQAAIEALDEAVLGRFARHDVVPFDATLFLPGQDCARGQLGAVVADDHERRGPHLDDPIEFTGNTHAR